MVFDPIRSRVGRPLPLKGRVFGRTSSGISSNGNRSKTMPCPKGLGGGNSYPRRSEGHRGLRWAGISIKKLRRKLFQDWTNRPADGRDARNFVCSPGPLGGSPANSGRHIVSVPSPARMRLNKRPCLTPPTPRTFPLAPFGHFPWGSATFRPSARMSASSRRTFAGWSGTIGDRAGGCGGPPGPRSATPVSRRRPSRITAIRSAQRGAVPDRAWR